MLLEESLAYIRRDDWRQSLFGGRRNLAGGFDMPDFGEPFIGDNAKETARLPYTNEVRERPTIFMSGSHR